MPRTNLFLLTEYSHLPWTSPNITEITFFSYSPLLMSLNSRCYGTACCMGDQLLISVKSSKNKLFAIIKLVGSRKKDEFLQRNESYRRDISRDTVILAKFLLSPFGNKTIPPGECNSVTTVEGM